MYSSGSSSWNIWFIAISASHITNLLEMSPVTCEQHNDGYEAVVFLRLRILIGGKREGGARCPDRGHAQHQAGGLEAEAQEAGGGEAEPPEEEREQSGGDCSHQGRESRHTTQHGFRHTLDQAEVREDERFDVGDWFNRNRDSQKL